MYIYIYMYIYIKVYDAGMRQGLYAETVGQVFDDIVELSGSDLGGFDRYVSFKIFLVYGALSYSCVRP